MPDSIPPINQNEKAPRQQVEDIFETEKKADQESPEVKVEQPESGRELTRESRPEKAASIESAEAEASHLGKMSPVSPSAPVPPVETVKSPELLKIEALLSEHLDELFLQMTPDQQIVFQRKGEITAGKIEKLMQDVKLKVRDVLSLIKEWLRLIPGINKFFLEQEAKIKTDRLLAIHEQKYKQK